MEFAGILNLFGLLLQRESADVLSAAKVRRQVCVRLLALSIQPIDGAHKEQEEEEEDQDKEEEEHIGCSLHLLCQSCTEPKWSTGVMSVLLRWRDDPLPAAGGAGPVQRSCHVSLCVFV